MPQYKHLSFFHTLGRWSMCDVYIQAVFAWRWRKWTELQLQQRPGNSISAHTFNYACYGHTEDKDTRWGRKHRLNGEYVTLRATINLYTKSADGLTVKEKSCREGNGEWIDHTWTDGKSRKEQIALLVSPRGLPKLAELPQNSVCVFQLPPSPQYLDLRMNMHVFDCLNMCICKVLCNFCKGEKALGWDLAERRCCLVLN